MADWPEIPIGVGVAVLLIREAVRVVKDLRQNDTDHNSRVINGSIGEKSVDFWQSRISTIVYTELERHVIPPLQAATEKLNEIEGTVNELKWRSRNGRRGD